VVTVKVGGFSVAVFAKYLPLFWGSPKLSLSLSFKMDFDPDSTLLEPCKNKIVVNLKKTQTVGETANILGLLAMFWFLTLYTSRIFILISNAQPAEAGFLLS